MLRTRARLRAHRCTCYTNVVPETEQPITLPSLNLKDAERTLCIQAIERSSTLIEAATRLGIDRHAMHRRVLKHGLTLPWLTRASGA